MNTDNKNVLLLVDDEPANIQVANSILKELYRVRVATNGNEALELARGASPPDLILLDIVMPEMSGYEVCACLKVDPDTRDIPIIFLTSKTEVDDETEGFLMGAVDYIHKPFSPPILKARVQTHLTLHKIQKRLAQQLEAVKAELEAARKIQLSILPSEVPAIAGLDIAARYVPMTEVAGDFYDFINIDENHLGIFVADVSGHGMSAALIASMLKIALAAQSTQALEPARVLTGLNQALCGKFHDRFVTAAYMVVDVKNKSICYAGAGHPPLLLGDKSAVTAHEVTENGLFLGAFPSATYSSVEMPFKEGDWAVLYTDGVLEMTNPTAEQFGAERFRKFLETHRELDADPFVDGLLEELSRWSFRASGREPEDDVTVLAIHFRDLD